MVTTWPCATLKPKKKLCKLLHGNNFIHSEPRMSPQFTFSRVVVAKTNTVSVVNFKFVTKWEVRDLSLGNGAILPWRDLARCGSVCADSVAAAVMAVYVGGEPSPRFLPCLFTTGPLLQLYSSLASLIKP